MIQETLNILETRADEYYKTSTEYKYVNSADLIKKVLSFSNTKGLDWVDTSIVYADKPGVKSTKHLVEFKFRELRRDLFGTPVVPRLLLWNSYNGECALTMNVGVFRLVCSNGLTIGKSVFKDKAIHRQGIAIERVLNDFTANLESSLDYIVNGMDNDFMSLMGGSLDHWEERRILRVMHDRGQITKGLMNKIFTELSSRRSEDVSPSIWNFYNVVNETMRKKSRSVLAQEDKNSSLMDDILNAV